MSHRMSKESASALAGAYGEIAKYREAYDILVQYIVMLPKEVQLEIEKKIMVLDL